MSVNVGVIVVDTIGPPEPPAPPDPPPDPEGDESVFPPRSQSRIAMTMTSSMGSDVEGVRDSRGRTLLVGIDDSRSRLASC